MKVFGWAHLKLQSHVPILRISRRRPGGLRGFWLEETTIQLWREGVIRGLKFPGNPKAGLSLSSVLGFGEKIVGGLLERREGNEEWAE